MATYRNPTSNIVHAAGKGVRTLCGRLHPGYVLQNTNRGVTCRACKAVTRK
jgi:hypothetical protein